MPLGPTGLEPECICPHKYTRSPTRSEAAPYAGPHFQTVQELKPGVSTGVTAATFISLKVTLLGQENKTTR